MAICLEITSTSFPFGEIHCTNFANRGINQINRKLPVILKTLCATAVLFASLDCPILASSAVIVVPILSPKRIGIAPARPITLDTPSAAGWDAKLCNTAIVALLLCTTTVMAVPKSSPRIGILETLSINVTNMGLSASGFITELMVSIPANKRPKAKMVCPIFFTFSFLETK